MSPTASRSALPGLVAVALVCGTAYAQPPEVPPAPAPHALRADGFLRHWLVLSPLPAPGGLAAPGLRDEAQVRPAPGDTVDVAGQELTWARYACRPDDPTVRLTPGVDSFIGYAVTYIVCDIEWKGLQLLCGADAGVRVWLNGGEILNAPGTVGPDGHKIAGVSLRKGTNALILKVLGGGGFSCTVRFADENGAPIPDLFLSQLPDPAQWPLPRAAAGGATAAPTAQGYVRDWLTLTHFPSNGSLDTHIVDDEANLRPRPGDGVAQGDQQHGWAPHRAVNFLLDLVHVVGGPCDGALGYGVAYILCNDNMSDLTLCVGADDVARVWLNGEPMMTTQSGWLAPDRDTKGGVTLRRGLNVLVGKVLNNDHLWQLSVRFLDAAGDPITDLSLAYTPDDPVLRPAQAWAWAGGGR